MEINDLNDLKRTGLIFEHFGESWDILCKGGLKNILSLKNILEDYVQID